MSLAVAIMGLALIVTTGRHPKGWQIVLGTPGVYHTERDIDYVDRRYIVNCGL